MCASRICCYLQQSARCFQSMFFPAVTRKWWRWIDSHSVLILFVVVVVVYLNESFVVWSVNLRDISSSHDEGELIQSVVNDHNFRLNFEVVRSPSLESTWQDRSCLFYKYSIDIKDLSNRKLMKICDSGHKCTNDDKQEASVVFTLKEIDDWFTR